MPPSSNPLAAFLTFFVVFFPLLLLSFLFGLIIPDQRQPGIWSVEGFLFGPHRPGEEEESVK